MGTDPTPRVFISHSSADLDFVARLASDLDTRLGDPHAVWYDARGLRGADQWWPVIRQELTDRYVFLIVLTPAAVASKWVRDELTIAWNQRNGAVGKLILPLLLMPCEVPEDLKILQTPMSLARATKRCSTRWRRPSARDASARPSSMCGWRDARSRQARLLRGQRTWWAARRSLATLLAHLRRGGAVSVFAVEGLPGVGKTALAAEAVAQLARDVETFPGGAAWVSCEGRAGAEGLATLWSDLPRPSAMRRSRRSLRLRSGAGRCGPRWPIPSSAGAPGAGQRGAGAGPRRPAGHLAGGRATVL